MSSQSSGAIYSDAWYKLAEAKVRLLPGVRISHQVYRQQRWLVLEDPYSHRFFRVTPQAYAFLQTLERDVTVDAAWREFLQTHPKEAPAQEEVVQLLSQLHVSNLLFFQEGADSVQIEKRARDIRNKELRGKLLSFLYFRIPIWNPDQFLGQVNAVLNRIPSWVFVALWLMGISSGIWAVLGHLDDLASHSQGVFAWANLPWLYVCLAVMKVVHEFAHGLVCKRYGGTVHTTGLMFLVTTPLPYVDTTASWSFSNKWHRMLVSLAGMLVDLLMAALGAVVWANTGPGLVNSLAFNVMMIGSVSSVLFNGNPLLRFDAYYVLADFLDIPNFYTKAQQYWYYLIDRYLLGSHAAQSPVDVESERKWLFIYAPTSLIYRLVVSYAIILFVMDLWVGLGLMVLSITFYMLFVLPAWKAIRYLTGPRVQTHRWRAFYGAGGLLAVCLLLGVVIPWPHSVNAQGVLQYSQVSVLHAPADAKLTRAVLGNGQQVNQGDPLLWFDDVVLKSEINKVQSELFELQASQRKALSERVADVQPLEEQVRVKQALITELQSRLGDLVVRAPYDGQYVALQGRERIGMSLTQGVELAHVLGNDGHFQFVAVISQERAREIFDSSLGRVVLRLVGQADETVAVKELILVPYKQRRLPSAALGWMGGGDLAVSREDSKGDKAVEDFFELRAVLIPDASQRIRLLHGLKGVLNVGLPSSTLFARLRESLQQLVQKRYGAT